MKRMTIAIAVLFALTSVATAAHINNGNDLGGEVGYQTAKTDTVNLSSSESKDFFEKAHGYVAPQ